MSFLSYVKEANVRQHHIVVQPSRPVAGDPPKQGPAAPSVRLVEAAGPVGTDPNLELVSSVHRSVVDELTTLRESVSDSVVDDAQLRRHVEQYAESQLADAAPTMPRATRGRLVADIADEVLGLGPLAPLLRDPSITEIVVNGHDQVFCERGGRLEPADCSFRSNDHIIEVVQRILWPIGRRLDLASPMVDARLPDGSRLNAIIPPLSLHGPAVTIRKFSGRFLRAEDLITHGTISASALTFLAACVRARLNIVVSGGTGSGKTTLLNLLGGFAFPHERIITIEDPAELQIHHRDLVSLETRPPNIDGTGQVVQRDLLKNALRMRPDRIIVGECRGGEAFDMLQAMNTGHDGSLTTVHANSARDALGRIQNMVMMAVELPVPVIREQIVSGIDLVVHLARQPDGSRKIVQILEILPLQEATITTQDLFTLRPVPDEAAIGHSGLTLQPTGIQPSFVDRLKLAGQTLPLGTFDPFIN
jgi:pilus assembly protein CpaF